MKKRKASLSLSVNAIVVLIIAIVMLGLALGFVRMMFGGAVDKISGVIADEPDPAPASAATPVTLSRGAVITTPAKDQGIKVAVYNSGTAALSDVVPVVTCTDGGDTAWTAFSTQALPRDIPARSATTFGVLLDIPDDAGAFSHLCQIKFGYPSASPTTYMDVAADFTLQVKLG